MRDFINNEYRWVLSFTGQEEAKETASLMNQFFDGFRCESIKGKNFWYVAVIDVETGNFWALL